MVFSPLAWGTEGISGPVRVEAFVCDLEVADDFYSGFCVVVLRTQTALREVSFSSDSEIGVIDPGLNINYDHNRWTVSGLYLRAGSSERIVLRVKGFLLNDTIKLPLFVFPYGVESSLVCASGRGKRFSSVGLDSDSLEEGRMRVTNDLSSAQISRLDSYLLSLRSLTTKSLKTPDYRFYVGEENYGVPVACTVSDTGDYSYLILLGTLVVLLALLFYFSKRKNAKVEELIEPSEGVSDWDTNRPVFEEILKSLTGDEYTVYRLVYDSGGVMLQKNIVERTGFPKSRVTRTLDRLGQKNMIDRMSYGITNKVILKTPKATYKP